MLKNTLINRNVTIKIAKALGDLNSNVVYVGGAMVSLYIDDPSADDVRPTKDIDISLEIANMGELEILRESLLEKGFKQSHEDDVICRFRYEDIKVDVMATKSIGWAPGNIWFARGFKHGKIVDIDDVTIKILPLPYFLATKFSAFYDRGGRDPRASHDFEDIVYLLNHTSTIKEQILTSEKDVQLYLKDGFLQILNDKTLQEAIIGNLFYEDQIKRFDKIITLLKDISNII